MRDTSRADALLARTRSEMLERQDEKWGWPRPAEFLEDDLGAPGRSSLGLLMQQIEGVSRYLMHGGRTCWLAILGEEIGEMARSQSPEDRIGELVQVAAVALSHAQAIQEQQLGNGDGLD